MPGTRTAGVVLAGGSCRRMQGLPKPLLRLEGGSTLLEVAVRALRAVGVDDVLVSSNDLDRESVGLPVLDDLRPGMGPLSGIESVLHRLDGHGRFLFLPCDNPIVWIDYLRDILAAVSGPRSAPSVLRSRGALQPAVLGIGRRWRYHVSRAISRGHLSIGRLWADLCCTPVATSHPVGNINSRSDLVAV